MRFEDADQITYEMADIEAQIIRLKNKKSLTVQEYDELQSLKSKLNHLRRMR